MAKQLPLVSVGISCFNQEKYIGAAIDSIISQDYPNFEIIISDDASTDNSYKIIGEYKKKYDSITSITVSQNSQNLGIGGNRNKIFSLSKGEYFLIADGDDISVPYRIDKLIKKIQSDTNLKLITSSAFEMSIDGLLLKTKITSIDETLTLDRYFTNPPLFWGACNLFHRSLYDEFGEFIKNVGADDQVLMVRALLTGKVTAIDEPLVYHRLGGTGNQKPKSAYAKRERLLRDNKKSLADYKQIMGDCSKYGKLDIANRYLSIKINLFEYIEKIIPMKKSSAIFFCLTYSRDKNFFKRIRYLMIIHFPQMFEPIFFLKRKVSLFKN